MQKFVDFRRNFFFRFCLRKCHQQSSNWFQTTGGYHLEHLHFASQWHLITLCQNTTYCAHYSWQCLLLLCLSAEALVPVVARLVRQNPVDVSYKGQAVVCQQKSLPKVDALCAAYVLVTLKLIFGLNDNQERWARFFRVWNPPASRMKDLSGCCHYMFGLP